MPPRLAARLNIHAQSPTDSEICSQLERSALEIVAKIITIEDKALKKYLHFIRAKIKENKKNKDELHRINGELTDVHKNLVPQGLESIIKQIQAIDGGALKKYLALVRTKIEKNKKNEDVLSPIKHELICILNSLKPEEHGAIAPSMQTKPIDFTPEEVQQLEQEHVEIELIMADLLNETCQETTDTSNTAEELAANIGFFSGRELQPLDEETPDDNFTLMMS